jgi:photosystem II stability/assembly factor-like uncharacterized protein
MFHSSSFLGALSTSLLLLAPVLHAQNSWSSSDPTGGTYARDWVGMTSTSDKQVVISQENLFVSSDSGSNWTRKSWLNAGETSSLALTDVDGSTQTKTLILCQGFAGKVRLSKDSGDSWTSVDSLGTKDWKFVTSSADGKTLTAYNGLKLCVSTDSGVSWTEKGLSKIASAANPWAPWVAVDAADDGKTLIVATSKNLYLTKDAGGSWSGVGNPGDLGKSQWRSVAINQDGTRIVAGTQGGKVYTGTKNGNAWTWTSTSFTGTWVVACSSDGKTIAAANYSRGGKKGKIQWSDNDGVTWTEQAPEGFWNCIGARSDGKFMAGALGEDIHQN